MPLSAKNVGVHPPQSPLLTRAVLTWSMNFSAAANPPDEPLNPAYFDNSDSAAATPVLHPLFMASAREVVGAWAALYAAGATKEEVIKHTFVHHTYDALFYRNVQAGSTLQTAVTLAGVGPHSSGGTHFLTALETTLHPSDACGSSSGRRGAGGLVGRSWWGGVVLGLGPADGDAKYMHGSECAAPPPRPAKKPLQSVQKHRIAVPPGQAHIFDGCIRDPRNIKATSADINPHTNIDFALKAGLQGRTLNGMCLLAFVLPAVLRVAAGAAAGCSSSTQPDHGRTRLQRIGCTFSNPVVLEYTAVDLDVHITAGGTAAPAPAAAAAAVAAATTTVHFEVYDSRGKRVIRDGFATIATTSLSKTCKVRPETSKL